MQTQYDKILVEFEKLIRDQAVIRYRQYPSLRRSHIGVDDLIQEGRVVLWRVLRRHDPALACLKTLFVRSYKNCVLDLVRSLLYKKRKMRTTALDHMMLDRIRGEADYTLSWNILFAHVWNHLTKKEQHVLTFLCSCQEIFEGKVLDKQIADVALVSRKFIPRLRIKVQRLVRREA